MDPYDECILSAPRIYKQLTMLINKYISRPSVAKHTLLAIFNIFSQKIRGKFCIIQRIVFLKKEIMINFQFGNMKKESDQFVMSYSRLRGESPGNELLVAWRKQNGIMKRLKKREKVNTNKPYNAQTVITPEDPQPDIIFNPG
ncbi:unnamed protein product [Rhizophagus irregularis]|nr:unnamed protein product [Rhizophagus irregularis]CAB5347709.1 unnamed protein product [Rhizophagus irregularis]